MLYEVITEACYLLGVIESRIGRSFWLSQTEFYLEQAILLAPDRAFANDAYELLEEFLVSVITSYSIHYTKLYECDRARPQVLRERRRGTGDPRHSAYDSWSVPPFHW